MRSDCIETELGMIALPPSDGNGVRCFKGIPYAAPPIGVLRWRPPKAAKAWTGLRVSDKFGPNAPQRILFDDIDPFVNGVSEDCLYLNVWTPDVGGKLPVLFWIHGGGFAVGSGSEPRYDGSKLAAHGIVVITINTRLNAFGFLAHPALTKEEGASGNFAMLDAVEALKWVHRNIAAFGGDPAQVTIAGESAGSMFASMLMASPLARGLFRAVIGESGAQFATPERPMKSLDQAHAQGLDLASKLGAKTADELRAVPAERILDAHPGLGFWPIVDGYFLPERPEAIFEKAAQADVPLLAGWNRDEGTNFDMLKWNKAAPTFEEIVSLVLPHHSKELIRFYAKSSKYPSRELGGDLVINNGAWRWLEAHRKTAKSEIFRYRFDRGPKLPQGKGWFDGVPDVGAFHSCEILYVFNTLQVFPWLTDEDDQKVADMMGGYWVNFVKTGNPNGSGLPPWPSYREPTRPAFIIDVGPRIENDPQREQHILLAEISRGL